VVQSPVNQADWIEPVVTTRLLSSLPDDIPEQWREVSWLCQLNLAETPEDHEVIVPNLRN